MFNAFDAWARMVSASWSMTQTGLRAAETMSAANDVVNARTALIRSAIASPMTADHRELGRIVPEKAEAFSRAGSTALTAWWAGQSALANEMQQLGAMAMHGRPPTVTELAELGSRMASLQLETFEAAARLGSATVTPVHRKVTANARRLKRKATRRAR